MRGKIVVALSGGVDSAVAAALLLEEGWEVIAATLLLWEGQGSGCRAAEAVADAGCIAGALGIPHYLINARETFRREVIGDFIDQYRCGRTPNPCIHCNRAVKFALMLAKAQELGASHLATGHYVRQGYHSRRKRYFLRKGFDSARDQSYTLFNLSQEQLARSLFPLGEKDKTAVRRLAQKFGLAVAEKRDSQEICFIPDDNYREFLQTAGVGESPGPIVNRAGAVLGTHRGIAFYTVGQRRGLGLATSRPLYIHEIRASDNTLVVGEKEELARAGMIVDRLNPVAIPDFGEIERAAVKIRYRAREAPAALALLPGGGALRVCFDRPQAAVAPGQAAVFYHGDLVLGGGIIREAF